MPVQVIKRANDNSVKRINAQHLYRTVAQPAKVGRKQKRLPAGSRFAQ
jgi:hypothetical protein